METLAAYASESGTETNSAGSSEPGAPAQGGLEASQKASGTAADYDSPCKKRRVGLALPSAADLLSETGGSTVLAELRGERAFYDRHHGRVRAFPHKEGKYATHVYIAVPVPAHCEAALSRVLHSCRRVEHGLLPLEDPGSSVWQKGRLVQAEYHLSLSRTVAVRKHQIQPLLADLRRCLAGTPSFEVELGALQAFTNDERMRSFLALEAATCTAEVCQAIRCVDAAFALHGLQPFHAHPRPHISVAWVLGDKERALAEHATSLNSSGCGSGMAGQGCAWVHTVDSILCRVGKVDHAVWPADSAASAMAAQ